MKRAPAAILLVLAAVASACSGTDEPASDDAAPAPSTTEAVADTCSPTLPTSTVAMGRGTFDGVERTWQVATPAGEPVAIIFDFHGTSGTIERQDAITRLSTEGPARGYIVVTPQGLENPTRWTVPGIPGPDDVSFAEQLGAQIAEEGCVDGPLVATGKSSGAGMAAQLACESDVFTIVAPVAGVNLYRRCATGEPVSVITYHGTADDWVPYVGPEGWEEVEAEEDTYFIGDVEATVAAFAERASCSEPETSTVGDDTTITSFSCSDGNRVTLYTIEGGGHTHPGAASKAVYEEGPDNGLGVVTTSFDGTTTMLDFFDQVIAERSSQ